MKRILSMSLVAGLFAMPVVGLIGCGEEAKTEQKETVSGPEGSTTTTVTKKVDSTGSNPPPNSAGEKVTPAK